MSEERGENGRESVRRGERMEDIVGGRGGENMRDSGRRGENERDCVRKGEKMGEIE